MKNQFYYKFKDAEGNEAEGSFNLDMVSRSVAMGDKFVVLLNDWHGVPRAEEVPLNDRGGKRIEVVYAPVCTEVWLDNKEDIEKFRHATMDTYINYTPEERTKIIESMTMYGGLPPKFEEIKQD